MFGSISSAIRRKILEWLLRDGIPEVKIGEGTIIIDGQSIRLASLTSDPSLAAGKIWYRSDLKDLRFSPDGTSAIKLLKDGDPVELKNGDYAGALVGISGTATGRAAKLDNLDAAISSRLKATVHVLSEDFIVEGDTWTDATGMIDSDDAIYYYRIYGRSSSSTYKTIHTRIIDNSGKVIEEADVSAGTTVTLCLLGWTVSRGFKLQARHDIETQKVYINAASSIVVKLL